MIYRILEMDGSDGSISFRFHIASCCHECSREISIAMPHGERSLSRGIQTISRISIHTAIICHSQIL